MSKEDFLKNLGQHIKQMREKKGLSAAEFARRAEMERSHIARLESGQTNPTSLTLKILCDALEMEFDEFFKGFKP
tara:strand:- start:49 stop:273 length:225 start_codon:yes stop_codon:yes gene_type:complete